MTSRTDMQGTAHRRECPVARLVCNMSLKHKLLAIIMLTCVPALALVGGVFIAWEWTSLRQAMVRDTSAQAEIVSRNCQAAVAFNDRTDTMEVLQTLETLPSIVAACIVSTEGSVLASYAREGFSHTHHAPNLRNDGPVFTDDGLVVQTPVMLDEERIGTLILRADLAAMSKRLRHSILVIVGVLLASSATAYLISSRLQGVISQPILRLAGVARIVAERKQYDLRAEQCGGGEVGLLIRAFNEMLEQIQRRDAALVEANEHLEARVQERTSALTATNEQLTHEIAFRQEMEQIITQRAERIASHQKALLRLAKETHNDLDVMIAKAMEETAKTLGVERTSVWFLSDDSSELTCRDLYVLRREVHERGHRLNAADYPEYFAEIQNTRIVVTDDARRDARTRCLTNSYLEPLGITSMMDVPMRLHGRLLGAFCSEHVGPMRKWLPEEQDFTASVANMIALHVQTTARMKLEHDIEKANGHLAETVRDLQRSNKELQDFAYVVSHDLRAPVRKIVSFGQLLQESLAARLEDDDAENLTFMIDGARRMHELIEALLLYSRVTTKGVPFDTLDMNAVMEDLKTVELAIGLEETGGTLSIPEPLPEVLGDPAQIRQLMQNLVSNALKYHRKNVPPEVTVTAQTQDSGMIRIEVQDNGIGIDPQYYDKLFIMFRRLHSSDEYEGTGIGLAVCKKIVERHGGEIGIASAPDQGSTFWFTLRTPQACNESDELILAPPELAHSTVQGDHT